MPIVKYSPEETRRRARVDRAKIAAMTEEDIARHAEEDGGQTVGAALRLDLEAGRDQLRAGLGIDAATVFAELKADDQDGKN